MTIHSLANYLRFMAEEMSIPMHLNEILSCTKEEYESHLEEMAVAAMNDACTQTNPRIPTKEEVIAIYKKLW
jgi:alcohol dehydrogenase class IV